MLLTFPAPDPLCGDDLAAEIATTLAVSTDEVDVVLTGTSISVTVPDGSDEATVDQAVSDHDPQVMSVTDYEFPADGESAALVRWQRRGAAETQVDYSVNGLEGVADADGVGVVELEVTADSAGSVSVVVGSLTADLAAQEV